VLIRTALIHKTSATDPRKGGGGAGTGHRITHKTQNRMPKIKGNAKLGSILKKNGISSSALKTKSGRKVRSDIKIATLRKRSGK
jgi:hypothetical protein